jgi:hypothetical protein
MVSLRAGPDIHSQSGRTPKTGAKLAAINVRCLDSVDVDALTIKKVDGRSLRFPQDSAINNVVWRRVTSGRNRSTASSKEA